MDQQAKVFEHACAKDDSNARSAWSNAAIFSARSDRTGKRSEIGTFTVSLTGFVRNLTKALSNQIKKMNEDQRENEERQS
jgi:hypothetical protein